MKLYISKNEELCPLEALEGLNNTDASKIAKQLDFRSKSGSVDLYALKQDR